MSDNDEALHDCGGTMVSRARTRQTTVDASRYRASQQVWAKNNLGFALHFLGVEIIENFGGHN
jgi:hypothetical protein